MESTFGTPVLPSSFIPATGCTIEPDPGLFFPPTMQGYKDLNIYNLYGELKNTGAIDAPLFPTNGIELLIAAVGFDGGKQPPGDYANTVYPTNGASIGTGYGVVGTPISTTPTTLSGAVTAGATSITVAAIPGGFTVGGSNSIVGQYVQVDVNTTTPGSLTTAECRLVTSASGTSTPFTLNFATTAGNPLVWGHASGANVYAVKAPFTHTILQANMLPSLTIEKNIGGYESLQFAGARINKYDLKSVSSETGTTITADIVAKNSIPLVPSPISVIEEEPFVFAECTSFDLFGQQLASTNISQASTFNLSIDNALKSTYTFNTTHTLSYLTPITRKITGDFSMVFFSLDDATYGYEQMLGLPPTVSATQGSLTFTLAHPSTQPTNFTAGENEFVTVTLPQVQFSKYADDLKMEDIVMSTINWEASLDLSNTTTVAPNNAPATIGVLIGNGQAIPY